VGALALPVLLAGCSLPTGAMYPAPPPKPIPDVPTAVLVDARARDGAPVVALFVPPRPGGRVIVFFHGNGMQLADTALLAELWRRRGLGVLSVEFPGYGLAPGTPSERSIYASAEGAFGWLSEHEGIDRERVVVVGYSLGSGAAVEMARRGHARALVLLAPIPSIPDIGRHYVPLLPASYFPDVYANVEKAKEIAIPVLLIHGTADLLIPPDTTLRLGETFPCSATLWGIGADHHIFRGHESDLADWIAAFATLDDRCQK
jgi:pimeloyl-ACP methyl ester carboxylesterase